MSALRSPKPEGRGALCAAVQSIGSAAKATAGQEQSLADAASRPRNFMNEVLTDAARSAA